MRFFLLLLAGLPLLGQQIELTGQGQPLIDRDALGNIWVVQTTRDSTLPVSPGALQPSFGGGLCIYQGFHNSTSTVPCTDAYIQKISPDGRTVLGSTYLGGSFDDLPRVIHADVDGSLWIAMETKTTNEFPAFASPLRNVLVIAKLSTDLKQIEKQRQLPFNATIADAIVSPGGIFLAASTSQDQGFQATVLSFSLDALDLRWRRDFDPVSAQISNALIRLSSGDLVLGLSTLDGVQSIAKVTSADGTIVSLKTLGRDYQIRSLAALPGESFVAGGSKQGIIGYYQRFNERLDPVEVPQKIGTSVNKVTADDQGMIGIWGLTSFGLDTTPNAPFRCLPDGRIYFYAALPYSEGSPTLVTYAGEDPGSNLLATLNGVPVFQVQSTLLFAKTPQSVQINAGCIDSHVQSYALTIGKASSVFSSELMDRHNVAPGELLTIYGSGFAKFRQSFDPQQLGELPLEVDGSSFLVDGLPAGVIDIDNHRASLAMPYGIQGRESVEVAWLRDGQRIGAIRLKVLESAPYALTEADPDGYRSGVYVHGKLSSADNVVYPGDDVTVYLVGAGALNQDVDSRKVLTLDPLPASGLEIRAAVEGAGYQVVTYAGAMKGQLPGLTQVNITIARDLKYFGRLTLNLFVNGRQASATFTMKQR